MLSKYIVASLSLAAIFASLPAYADNDDSCAIQFAVSTPPIQPNQNVAFNVTNDNGLSKSITLAGGSAPQFIDNLQCGNYTYTVSATAYSTPSNNSRSASAIGECVLKAGAVYLNGSNNSVSLVFPNDFVCALA